MLQHVTGITNAIEGTEADVYAEIGAIVDGKKPGRTDPNAVTVFDSTGLGAQDLAIVNLVYESMKEK